MAVGQVIISPRWVSFAAGKGRTDRRRRVSVGGAPGGLSSPTAFSDACSVVVPNRRSPLRERERGTTRIWAFLGTSGNDLGTGNGHAVSGFSPSLPTVGLVGVVAKPLSEMEIVRLRVVGLSVGPHRGELGVSVR